ncbi:hypothetical protein LBMAG43_01030 [Methylococcaceae bacterium]|nr:hypothetical protein LBMAG43_01030 [Methylococcaceae bacterium]
MAANEKITDIKSKGTTWILGVLASLVLFVVLILTQWWGREPIQFNILESAISQAGLVAPELPPESEDLEGGRGYQEAASYEILAAELPLGYTYTATLAHIADTLLNKSGGYITNDIAPPGVILDNITSWEFGALVMLRDATTALRNHFARDQSQSEQDPDLAVAEPYFYYEPNSWALPATEGEYEKGIQALHKYMRRLQDPNAVKKAQFYSRADNLWQYTEVVIKRLGDLSTRLSSNASSSNFAPGLTNLELEEASGKLAAKVGWMEIDNVFYEARGASWALLHILRAIKHDFHDILLDKRAMRTVDVMIRELENSLTPTLSPMVLDGSGYGLFANYSLSMANYIARANAAALDLRDIMNRG